jgi:hypothetical protein
VKRRERTRQLIELGGLIAKAGIIDLTDDDRAAIYGALLQVAAVLRDRDRDEKLTIWRRRGNWRSKRNLRTNALRLPMNDCGENCACFAQSRPLQADINMLLRSSAYEPSIPIPDAEGVAAIIGVVPPCNHIRASRRT